MRTPFLREHGRTLLDAIFHEQNQKLLEEFHARLEKLDKRQQLASICGIDDEELLSHLVELDMQPEVVAAIAVVPLVVVAWADGAVQDAERQAILQAADSCGVPAEDGRFPVLEHWLSHKPGPEVLDAWKLYIAALCKQLSAEEVTELKEDLLGRVQTIAEAAGGLLGLTSKISSKEQAMITTLEQAFAV